MFEQYFVEEYGRECLKNEYGFILYGIHGEECHLADMYIKPEYRKTYEGKKLFSKLIEVARGSEAKYISTLVSVGKKRSEKASKLMRGFLSLGFKIESADNDQIILIYNL